MTNVDELLQPITPEKPCGEDFTYHPAFQNLETLLRGKPETQFSPAEEPQWKEVRETALEVLRQSKHLTAGIILTVSLVKLEGLEGFRDGVALLHGLVERFWADLYPKLDPEDNNDPTERLNILNNLSSPGAPYRMLLHLTQVVVCSAPSMGRITLEQLMKARDKSRGDSTGEASANGQPDLKQIEAAFREAGPEPAKQTLNLVNETIAHAQALANLLETTLGAGGGVNFESLTQILSELKQGVEPYAAGDTPPVAEGATSSAAPMALPGGRAALSGAIQSRSDVIKALDLICDYYRAQEPSSPVPLILQRAQRLVDKDFMTIMTDLTPDALSQLQVITGKPKE